MHEDRGKKTEVRIKFDLDLFKQLSQAQIIELFEKEILNSIFSYLDKSSPKPFLKITEWSYEVFADTDVRV